MPRLTAGGVERALRIVCKTSIVHGFRSALEFSERRGRVYEHWTIEFVRCTNDDCVIAAATIEEPGLGLTGR